MPAKTSDVAERNKSRPVAVPVKLWARKKGDWIRIRIVAPGQPPAWVTNDPGSVRFHKTLFRDLKKTLIARGAWPFEDGGEIAPTTPNASLDRELEYFRSGKSRYHPVLAKGGASASEMLLRERDRF